MAQTTLLLTRPHHGAQAFLTGLDAAAVRRVNVLIAPLMEISGTGAQVDIPAGGGVIFTSAAAVEFTPEGAGRRAYCVGAGTTAQATALGWHAVQSGETAEELITALRRSPPDGSLLHLGGRHTRGDIAARLSAAGIPTRHVVLYDQTLLPLAAAARDALAGPCIIPLFSPRTAAHLVAEAGPLLARARIIALSEAVAAPLEGENVPCIIILPAPRVRLMRNAVENLCRSASLP